MARSYYETLGLKRDASQKEIKAAYRRLARKHHPDVNPGDKSAEGRFKEINRAFEALSDADKRAKYDRYGENWEQAEAVEKARAAYGGSRGGSQAHHGGQAFTFDINDLLRRQGGGGGGGFEEVLGGIFGGGRGRRGPARGQNVEYAAGITLEEAYHGTARTLQLQSQETCATCGGRGEIAGAVCHACEGGGAVLRPKRIEVKIPAGAKDGTRVRIAGEGSPGMGSGPRGDLYVVVKVRSHARFERRGDDLIAEISVPVEDAVLGGEAHVGTIAGKRIAVTIPPLTQNGRTIRLAGLGMPKLESRKGHGDLLVKVRLVIPEKLTDEERALFEQLRAVRKGEKTGAKA
jgi:DnaJ-class molecular chaperone